MLPDVQNSKPKIEIALNRVGISKFKLPIFVSRKGGGQQHTVAEICCFVDLEKNVKGINMSRLPISLHKFLDQPLSSSVLENIAENVRVKSEAKICEISYTFDYFISKFSPVNKEPGLVNHIVTFTGIKSKDDFSFKIKIRTTATSLCPCSKEISAANAHNQKCYIELECETSKLIWIEDLIKIAERSASCEIFSVLKRPDEKYVTEKMYNNPQFVEDIARECYDKIISLDGIIKFNIKVESDESIHIHRAIAMIGT